MSFLRHITERVLSKSPGNRDLHQYSTLSGQVIPRRVALQQSSTPLYLTAQNYVKEMENEY